MNSKLVPTLVTGLILSIVTSAISYNIARSDKDYCYDDVGDKEPCFKTINNCKHEEKKDDIAESPCYNKDHTF